jgi:hypothetical protein
MFDDLNMVNLTLRHIYLHCITLKTKKMGTNDNLKICIMCHLNSQGVLYAFVVIY